MSARRDDALTLALLATRRENTEELATLKRQGARQLRSDRREARTVARRESWYPAGSEWLVQP